MGRLPVLLLKTVSNVYPIKTRLYLNNIYDSASRNTLSSLNPNCRKALTISCEAFRSTQIESLHALDNELTLHEQREYLSLRYYYKIRSYLSVLLTLLLRIPETIHYLPIDKLVKSSPFEQNYTFKYVTWEIGPSCLSFYISHHPLIHQLFINFSVNEHLNHRFVIFSDSRSVLLKLSNHKSENPLIRKILHRVSNLKFDKVG